MIGPMACGSPRSPDEIEQREQKNPHDIHEVPVQSNVLDGRIPSRRERSPLGHDDESGKHPYADYHVDGMHSRHGEIQEKEDLRGARKPRIIIVERRTGDMMLFEFFVVLESLETEEYA